MSYQLKLPDGTLLTTIPEKQIYSDYGIKFTGRRVIDYGEIRNQNLVNIIANFASGDNGSGEPNSINGDGLKGQLWYNTTEDEYYFFNGTNWVSLVSTISFSSSDVSYDNSTSGLTATNVQDAIDEVENRLDTAETNITNHINDGTDAHDASAISFNPYGSVGSTNVQEAIEELEDEVDGVQTGVSNNASNLTAHINDGADAHDASAISFNPYGSVGSTNVQSAIQELENEVDGVQTGVSNNASNLTAHINDGADAHDASAISVSPTVAGGNDVQSALQGLESGGLPGTGTTSAFTPYSRQFITRNMPSGLSGPPDMIQLILVNATFDNGYSPGDIVVINPQGNQLDEGSGPAQEFCLVGYDDSTNRLTVILNMRKGREILIADRNAPTANSNAVEIVPARWNAYLKVIVF